MRDADSISRAKTDVLRADILKLSSLKNAILENECAISPYFCTVTYILILHAVLHHKYLVLYRK